MELSIITLKYAVTSASQFLEKLILRCMVFKETTASLGVLSRTIGLLVKKSTSDLCIRK